MRGIEGVEPTQTVAPSQLLSDFTNDPVVSLILKQLEEVDRHAFLKGIVIIDNRAVSLSFMEIKSLKPHEVAALLTFLGFSINPHSILDGSIQNQRGSNDYTQDYPGYSCVPSIYHPKGECQEAPGRICSINCGKK